MKTRTIKHGNNHYDTEAYVQTTGGEWVWAVVKCSVKLDFTPKHEEKTHTTPKKNKSKSKSNKKRYEKYGITENNYDAIFDSQNGVCAICGSPPKGDRELVIDHNHNTGKVRGLLCVTCNAGIGMLKDNKQILKRASDYL